MMANKRRAVSKRIRFEVFRRDSFTCQFCGSKAPEVILHLDHIQPVSKGGSNDILNLITSCESCNSGKSNRELTDNTILEKRRKQLEELQKRKEQIEMMFEWQKGLASLDADVLSELAEFWQSLTPGYSLNETGLFRLKKLLKVFTVNEVMEAMRKSVDQYVGWDFDQERIEKAFRLIGPICTVTRTKHKKPYIEKLFYIRGILRNRLSYLNERLALTLLEQCVECGADVHDLQEQAMTAKNWTEWKSTVESIISGGKAQ